ERATRSFEELAVWTVTVPSSEARAKPESPREPKPPKQAAADAQDLGPLFVSTFRELKRPFGVLAHDGIELAPGASRELEFALVWHFPNFDHGRWYPTR